MGYFLREHSKKDEIKKEEGEDGDDTNKIPGCDFDLTGNCGFVNFVSVCDARMKRDCDEFLIIFCQIF